MRNFSLRAAHRRGDGGAHGGGVVAGDMPGPLGRAPRDTLDISQSNGALDSRTRHVTRIDTERGGATARDGGNLEAGSTRRDPS